MRSRILVLSFILTLMISALLITEERGRAQSSGDGPDYTNVNDFLNGETHLLRNDDLIIRFQNPDAIVQGSYQAFYTSNSTANPLTYAWDTNSDALPGEAVGRFFNTSADLMVRFPDHTSENTSAPPGLGAVWYSSSQGGGIYLSRTDVPFVTGTMFYARVGDFNGDGFDDVLMSWQQPGTAHAALRIATAADVNDAGKGFKFGPQFTLNNPYGIREIEVGEFNGDLTPDIASLYISPDKNIHLATYSVDPKTLTISSSDDITLNQAADTGPHPLTMTAGRFTAATHDQLMIGSQLQDGGPMIIQSIDFTSVMGSVTPKVMATSQPSGSGSSIIYKLKAGRMIWNSPNDQLVWMTSTFQYGTTLAVLKVDPASLAVTWPSGTSNTSVSPLPDPEGSAVRFRGYDFAIGNFDHMRPVQPPPTDPNAPKSERNPDLEIVVVGDRINASNGEHGTALVAIYELSRDLTTLTNISNQIPGFTGAGETITGMSVFGLDLQARSYRLGAPNKVIIDTSQPALTLAAPPMHVDYVTPAGALTPDILNISVIPDGFYTQYDLDTSTTTKTNDTDTTSYSFGAAESLGAKLSIGDEDEGDGATGSLTFKAAQDLKHSAGTLNGSFQSQEFNISQTTSENDQLWFKDTQFTIWVFPVLGQTVCPKAKPNCQPGEKVPLTIQFSGPSPTEIKTVSAGNVEWYQPPWEFGNVFSYLASESQLQAYVSNFDPLSNTGADSLTFYTDTSHLTVKNTWKDNTSTGSTTSSDTNFSFELDTSYSNTFGVGKVLTGNTTASLDLSGSYGFSHLHKSITTTASSTGISVAKLGNFAEPSFYSYAVKPYIFGQKRADGDVDTNPLTGDIQTSGSLRTAFVVDPTDSLAGRWWSQTYSGAPDVALNHPTRWYVTTPGLSNPVPNNCRPTGTGASQMNCVNLSVASPDNPWEDNFHAMRGLFITSANFPGQGPQLSRAIAGDQLKLQARVYNYSLAAMPAGTTVHVRFYGLPWNITTQMPAGGAFPIGSEVSLPPIPPFDATPNAPFNWVLATSDNFDTTNYSDQYLTFFVVVWMQDANENLVQELPGHGMKAIPGSIKSFADAAGFEEVVQVQGNTVSYSNNVGFYDSAFYILPNTSSASARPSAERAPELKIDQVKVSSQSIKEGQSIELSAMLQTGAESITGLMVDFYDGDPAAGGKLFDVERIPHIRANDKYLTAIKFRTNTCGSHRIFVKAGSGRVYEATASSPAVQVECSPPVCVAQVCMKSARYYALNPNQLPRGMVTVPKGVETKVSTSDTTRMLMLLQGGASEQQKLTQQFVATQLNLLGPSGSNQAALRSNLLCYKLNFQPVYLSTGFTLNPSMTLGELFDQALKAGRSRDAIDKRLIANLLQLLNGDDATGRCNRSSP